MYRPELLEKMRASGCHTLIVGFDSADLSQLRRYGRIHAMSDGLRHYVELNGATVTADTARLNPKSPGYERWVIDWPRRLRLAGLTTLFLRPDKNILAWLPPAKKMARRIAAQHPIEAVYVSAGPFSNVSSRSGMSSSVKSPWMNSTPLARRCSSTRHPCW